MGENLMMLGYTFDSFSLPITDQVLDINNFFHGQLGLYSNTDTSFYPAAYKNRGFGFDGVDDVITLPKNSY